ncbi:MAG: hypothetical protein ACFFFO_04015 [Candidatus Thorarchaeota archaeon]
MPLNRPALDSRGYREILSVSVMIFSVALTMIFPDSIPIAIYLVQPSSSALRDSSILTLRLLVNAIAWGILTYMFVRVSERLRHKGR